MRGKEAESNLNWELYEEQNAGNPPSFMFVLNYLLDHAKAHDDQRIVKALKEIEDRIVSWYGYYADRLSNNATNLNYTFQWMDVKKEGALSSGLDDYPRGFR